MEYRTDNEPYTTTATPTTTTSQTHLPPLLAAPRNTTSQRGAPSSSSSTTDSHRTGGGGTEPVRSRWTPKPEQILILESIFNSGMVNPHKEETIRIRKLLEKFGPVGDANVFYWFQNRRSRSRRRQRQLQASLAAAAVEAETVADGGVPSVNVVGGVGVGEGINNNNNNNNSISSNSQLLGAVATCGGGGGGSLFLGLNNDGSIPDYSNIISGGGVNNNNQQQQMMVPSSSSSSPSSSHGCLFGNSSDSGLFSTTTHEMQSSVMCSPLNNPNLGFLQTVVPGGIITVFVNGVPTQVPAGPFDMKAIFGEEVIVVHQTGIPVPLSDFGISSLQHGESYFLVPRFD